VERWTNAYPNIPMLNAYGPTECSDDVTHYKIDPLVVKSRQVVPIGKPVINTSLYILDRHLIPVPIGVCGELYIGGDGVGRGYLHDIDKTREAFVPNPFLSRTELEADKNTVLYKTGDLGRYWLDGTIEFR